MSTHLRRKANSSHFWKRTKVKDWPERSNLSNPEFLKHPDHAWSKQLNLACRSWSRAADCRRRDSFCHSQISQLGLWDCRITLLRLENLQHTSAVQCCTQCKLIYQQTLLLLKNHRITQYQDGSTGRTKGSAARISINIAVCTLCCLVGGKLPCCTVSRLVRAGPECSNADQNGVLIKLCKKMIFQSKVWKIQKIKKIRLKVLLQSKPKFVCFFEFSTNQTHPFNTHTKITFFIRPD